MKNENRLDYFSHSMAGLAVGLVFYALYVSIVRAQPTTRDYEGFTLVWGSRVMDVFSWGYCIPLGFVILSLLVAKFCPAPQIYSRPAFLIALLAFVVFMLVIVSIESNMIIRVFHDYTQQVRT